MFASEAGAWKLEVLEVRMRNFSILGLLLGWRLLSVLYEPMLNGGIRFVYLGYRLS